MSRASASGRGRSPSIREVTAAPVTPLPAATVVVIRPSSDGIEVLLTHRPATMRFAGDMHVFPGGRVDAADASGDIVGRTVIGASEAAIRLGGDLDPRAAAAAHVAAIRELWEESGILLADTPAARDAVDAARAKLVAGAAEFTELAAALDLRLRTDLLVPLSRWVTPPGYPRRFDARFVAAVLPADAAAASIASSRS